MRTTSHQTTHLRAAATRGPDGRRGAALMLALIVLSALFLLAVPFAVFMRMQHSAGTQALHTARARTGAAGALSHARAVLARGIESVETDDPVFPFHEADVDTLWEFHVTLRTRATSGFGSGADTFDVDNAVGFPNDGDAGTVDGYIRVEDEWMAYSDLTFGTGTEATLTVELEHRGLFGTTDAAHAVDAIVSFYPDTELWDLDVQDQQALINVNTAPYDVILNLLGYLEIGGPDPSDATFPSERQRDLARAISTYRVDYSYWENDDGSDDIPNGTYTPFQNLNMLKNIAAASYVDGLRGEEFDKLRRYVTVHSAYTGTTRWGNDLGLQGDIEDTPAGADTGRGAANLSIVEGVGVGTMVRLTNTGTDVSEYRIVSARNQNTTIAGVGVLAGDVTVPIASAAGFRQMSDDTRGYIFINDANPEWISYTGVDTSVSPPELTDVEHDVWGGSPLNGVEFDHANGVTLDGCVISWEYDLDNTYSAAPPPPGDVVVAEARHAININTVTSPIVLRSLLLGVSDGTNEIEILPGRDEPTLVADRLLEHRAGEAARTYFDGNEVWYDPSETGTNSPEDVEDQFDLAETAGDIDGGDAQLLKNNFDTTAGNWPAFSTVPLRFNSGTLIAISSQGIVDDRAGTPIAQAPPKAGLVIARIYDVVPPLEPLFWILRSQSDFYNHKEDTGLSGEVFTNPLNMGFDPGTFDTATMAIYEDIRNYDPPTFTTPGTAAPGLDTLDHTIYTTMLEGLHGAPNFEPDYSIAGDTEMVKAGTFADTTNTTSEGIKSVHLQYNTHYEEAAGERHIEADSFDATMQPFAVEFWIRPGLNVSDRQLLVDLGADADPDDYTAVNQVRVYLEGGRLVLRIDEPIYTAPLTAEYAGYAGYVLAESTEAAFPFEAGEWHHVAIAAVGTFRDEIAMFIDGIYDSDMDWTYHYEDTMGVSHEATEATGINPVQEGSFLPVAMSYPNQTTTVTLGPPAFGGQWPGPGVVNQIGLVDASWLPPQGAVVIGSSDHPYAYGAIVLDAFQVEDPPGSGFMVDVDTLQLVDFADGTGATLDETHVKGELVALMLPVARTAAHTDSYTSPVGGVGGDEVALWHHNEVVAGNGSYEIDPTPSATYAIGSTRKMGITVAWPTWPSYLDYEWLGLDPNSFPPGGGDFLPANRWKALVTHTAAVTANEGLLCGSLPTGDLGTAFNVGAARDGSEVFQGELDELRITALPILLVAPDGAGGGWAFNAIDADVERWDWDDTAGWPLLRHANGYAFDMADVPPGVPPMPDGGLFMVEGQIYSYLTFDGVTFDDVAQVNDDLTPKGVPGFGQAHAALRKIIPLNFMTTTRISFPIDGTQTTGIIVADRTQLPPNGGYLKIEDEILAYQSVTPGAGTEGELVLSAPYRRGCYGTAGDIHPTLLNAGRILRHLPVRHLDRYRAGENPADPAYPWDVHTSYTALGSEMCMYSFSVNHAGKLRRVRWRFKTPLEDNQKVAVVVMIDGAEDWFDNPDASNADNIWGKVCDSTAPQEDVLSLYNAAVPPERPDVGSRVEVRFYFDLSETNPYNTTYAAGAPVPDGGWSKMVELDEVGIEMVPEPMTF